ncbi:MAG: hypothetical protein GY856_27915, partial [bacterium]|nr:hypothetical protein [bacterium]
MNDNIRICQVEVALLHSDDAGQSWQETPPGGGLPATFGNPGSCPYPGEQTTSLSYTVPETPPSGLVGSLYKLRVRATDQADNVSEAKSGAPFLIVQPAPDVRTLILANLSRMQTTAGLRAELENLAAHSRVR